MTAAARVLIGGAVCLLSAQDRPVDPDAAAVAFKLRGASEIRTHRVNLDEDAAPEAVVVASWKRGGPPEAIVFDRMGEKWIAVGEFDGGRHWVAPDASGFLDLRPLGPAGKTGLIVRERNGGTGVLGTYLSVHRLRNGKLQEVFQAVESEARHLDESAVTEIEAARFRFDPSRITVRRSEIRRPDFAVSGKPPVEVASCAVFRWDEPSFRFQPSKEDTRRTCLVSR